VMSRVGVVELTDIELKTTANVGKSEMSGLQ